MSLKVLLNGPKGSGKSTLVRNMLKHYIPPIGQKWLFIDRGRTKEMRHIPTALTKVSKQLNEQKFLTKDIKKLNKIRKYFEQGKKSRILEFYMLFYTPLYLFNIIRLDERAKPDTLINGIPLEIRNLKVLHRYIPGIANVRLVRKLAFWPSKYDLIVNLIVDPYTAIDRVVYKRRTSMYKLEYVEKVVDEELKFIEFLNDKYPSVVNIDSQKQSWDTSSEFCVYIEVLNNLLQQKAGERYTFEHPNVNYTEGDSIKSYFDKHIRTAVSTFYDKDNPFVNFVLEVYDRQHLFVFTDVLARKINYPFSTELACVLLGIWGYLLWYSDESQLQYLTDEQADKHLTYVYSIAEKLLGRDASSMSQIAVKITKDAMNKQTKIGFWADYISIFSVYLDLGYSYIVCPTSILSTNLHFNQRIFFYRALINKHIAGHLLKDMMDIKTGEFKCLSRKKMTYPLALLRDNCNSKELKWLESLYGKTLTAEEKEKLKDISSRKNILRKCQNLVNIYLKEALDSLDSVNTMFLDGPLDLGLLRNWLEYRIT